MLDRIVFFLIHISPRKTDFIYEYLNKKIDKTYSLLFFNIENYLSEYPQLKKGRKLVYYYSHYKAFGHKKSINPHPLFDSTYYVENYPEVLLSGMNPLKHFLKTGGKLLYNTHPAFNSASYKDQYLKNDDTAVIPVIHFLSTGWKLGYNPNELFNTFFYLEAYHDVASSGINPFEHYLTNGYIEKRIPSVDFKHDYFNDFFSVAIKENKNPLVWYYSLKIKPDLPKRISYDSDTLMYQLLIRACAIEPKIALNYLHEYDITIHSILPGKFSKIFEKEITSVKTKPDYILLLPWLKKGGSDWVACVHINYLLSRNYNVLLITTETEDLSSIDWLIQKPAIITLSKYKNELNYNDYMQLLLSFCIHLKPKVIHNNNSKLGWDLYKAFGNQLCSVSKIYASIFCHDYDENNIKMGYIIQYLNDTIKYLDHILTDNIQIINDIKNELGFTQKEISKFKNVYYLPQKMGDKEGMFLDRNLRQIIASGRPKVFWASRICNQKRLDILLKIILENPHIDFHIYGYIDSPNQYYTVLSELSNVVVKGKFNAFSEILDINYIAFLYTSSWDGLPNVLIEACLAGIPVISANVGGIKELINHQTGYLIDNTESIESYTKALSNILEQPEYASVLAKNAYELIITRHNIPNMENTFSECGYLI